MLGREEQREFDEIARRIDQDTAGTGMHPPPVPAITADLPVRQVALGLFVVGVTGVLTGLAWSDLVVLTLVGMAPIALAMALFALAGTALLERFLLCAEDGCERRAMNMGWCSEHASVYDPGPDEYWGDL